MRVVTLGPPPIPLKPMARRGVFFLTKFPCAFAKAGDEWCSAVLGRKEVGWRDVEAKFKKGLDAYALRKYKRQFSMSFRVG